MIKSTKKCFNVIFCIVVSAFVGIALANEENSSPETCEKNGTGVPCDFSPSPWERIQDALQRAQKEHGGNSPCSLKETSLEWRWQIAEQGRIPKWDGKKLTDVSGSICGATQLDADAKRLLAKLNYWEQAFGESSYPPELRRVMASSGEERGAIAMYVRELGKKGIFVELDYDEGLWRVVGDENAEAFSGTMK